MKKFNKDLTCIQLYSTEEISRVLTLPISTAFLSLKNHSWITKTKPRALQPGITEEVHYNLGKCHLFVTLLLHLGCYKQFIDDGGWHSLSQKRLKNYFPDTDISKITNLLHQLGIIEKTTRYVTGLSPKQYRLADKFRYGIPIELDTYFHASQQKTENWLKNWNCNPDGPFEQWLCDNVEKTTILPEALDTIKKLDFSDATDPIYAKKCAFNSYHMIKSFSSEDESQLIFSRDSTVRRIHTNITMQKSELREHLRYKDKQIGVIDLNASHPFWLLSLYKTLLRLNNPKAIKESQSYYSHWTSDQDFYQTLASKLGLEANRKEIKGAFFEKFLYVRHPFGEFGKKINDYYKEKFPILHRQIRIRRKEIVLPPGNPFWRKNSPMHNMKIEFIKCSSKKEIPKTGDNIAYVVNIQGALFFRIIGRKNKILVDKSEKQLKNKKAKLREFKRSVSDLWDGRKIPKPQLAELRLPLGLITGLVKPHGQLSVENMRIESEAFIDGAAKEIFEKDKFWIITIHDAIGCELENLGKVEEILTKHIISKTGFAPILKTEILGSTTAKENAGVQHLDNADISSKLKAFGNATELPEHNTVSTGELIL